MSHRMALAASTTLTVRLAVGIVVARDQFFADELAANSPMVTQSTGGLIQTGAKVASGADTASAPRVIEVRLPAQRTEGVPGTDDRNGLVRGDDEHEEKDND